MDWRSSEFLKLQYVYMTEAVKPLLPRNDSFKLQWWWFGHREASLNPKQTYRTPPVQIWRHNDLSVELIVALDLRGKGVYTDLTERDVCCKWIDIKINTSPSLDTDLVYSIWEETSRSSALNEPEHTVGTKRPVSALYCTECVILGTIVLFRIKLTLNGFNQIYQITLY